MVGMVETHVLNSYDVLDFDDDQLDNVRVAESLSIVNLAYIV